MAVIDAIYYWFVVGLIGVGLGLFMAYKTNEWLAKRDKNNQR